jgi:hypothetical protein
MKLASVENAHAESDIFRSGRLHALVHEPEPPIAGQKVFEPNTGDLAARAESKQGKERVARSSGQFEIASLELKRLAAEECIECSPPALVRRAPKMYDCSEPFGMPFTNHEVAVIVANELNRHERGMWSYKVERHIDGKRWIIVRDHPGDVFLRARGHETAQESSNVYVIDKWASWTL